jgi:hypothetical protein
MEWPEGKKIPIIYRNRTRDLAAYSAGPQSTAPPRALFLPQDFQPNSEILTQISPEQLLPTSFPFINHATSTLYAIQSTLQQTASLN